MIQAYIFSILAMVYISSALMTHKGNDSLSTTSTTPATTITKNSQTTNDPTQPGGQ
jgi:hypothetical protein